MGGWILAARSSPPWRLQQHWPGSELIFVGGAGHDARDPGMTESIVVATDRFA